MLLILEKNKKFSRAVRQALLERCAFLRQTFDERVNGHHTQIHAATGTHGYRIRFLLFVPYDNKVRNLLQ